MAEETQVEVAPEAEGMAALGVLTDTPAEQAVAAPVEPKIDAQGRSYATGRRKNATARVWLKRGSGLIVINGRDVTRYFARPVLQMLLQQPFETTERVGEFDVMATGLRPVLKAGGFMTRDSRVVERKKYGKAKARKSFQFSKR